MRIAVRVFFKSIHITGRENIPAKGPLIIVANHPSTFMDPIVIATILKRKIFFLAKGEAFKSGFAKWILPKFNMIPVYRKQDNAAEFHKNEETFDKCYEHLENNGVILIFPEGTSITERKLRKIKTGAARIALGAEAKNNFTLGIKILQIGLNYSDPHAFKSDLLVKMDQPTHVADFAEEYRVDEFKTAHKLTEEIKLRLEEHMITVENEHLDELLKNIETIYKIKLAKELGVSLKAKDEDFLLTRNIAERLHYFQETDPERVVRIGNRVKSYLGNLNKVGISDAVIHSGKRSFLRNAILSILYVVLGLPFFIYGLINNYLPYRIPGLIAQTFAKEKEYYGPVAMVSGTFTFLIFYSIQIYFVADYFHRFLYTLAYLLSLPLSGYFAYSYYYTVKSIRAKWLFISLFFSRTALIASLMEQRKLIVREFEAARTEYHTLSFQKITHE